MAKIVFRTYGCSNNFSESEAMAGLLEKAGFKNVVLMDCNVCSGVFKSKDFKKYKGNSIFVEAQK